MYAEEWHVAAMTLILLDNLVETGKIGLEFEEEAVHVLVAVASRSAFPANCCQIIHTSSSAAQRFAE